MASMWATGNRANRVWIYALSFCLVVFFCTFVGATVYSLYLKETWPHIFRMAIGSAFFIWIVFDALQKRRKRS
jgi:uncharacterized membrane protein